MRFIDSRTLVPSGLLPLGKGGSRVLNWPVLTKPTVSAELDTLVGWAAAMTMVGGAIELPPDTELSEPIRLSRPPRAPYSYMAYIGLCGLVFVSFCDRAGITVPLVP